MPGTEIREIWKHLALEWKTKLFTVFYMDTTDPNFDWASLTRFMLDTTAYYRRYLNRVRWHIGESEPSRTH